MSPQEYDIYHYLNRTPGLFIPIYEIVKQVGGNRSFANGRYWALDSLKRMEGEGLVERNDAEEFRIRHQPDDTTEFLRALQRPGLSAGLGDTAIITIRDVERSP
jgi:hypothetical protein